jgi:hypothetical protein
MDHRFFIKLDAVFLPLWSMAEEVVASKVSETGFTECHVQLESTTEPIFGVRSTLIGLFDLLDTAAEFIDPALKDLPATFDASSGLSLVIHCRLVVFGNTVPKRVRRLVC